MDYSGSNIVVTGGASGIGDAILRAFSGQRRKSRLYSLDVKHPEDPITKVEYKNTDVSKSEQVELCFASIGDINYLIHSAGLRADETPNGLNSMINVNMTGTYNVFHFGMHHMKPGSTIVHICSESILFPAEEGTKSYVDTKLFGYIIGKNITSAARKLRYKAAFPGPVDTPLFRRGKTEEQIQRIAPVSPDYLAEHVMELVKSDQDALLCRKENSVWIYELGNLPKLQHPHSSMT